MELELIISEVQPLNIVFSLKDLFANRFQISNNEFLIFRDHKHSRDCSEHC